jgi:hypothetical protein
MGSDPRDNDVLSTLRFHEGQTPFPRPLCLRVSVVHRQGVESKRPYRIAMGLPGEPVAPFSGRGTKI